jgi:hypothetical protein
LKRRRFAAALLFLAVVRAPEPASAHKFYASLAQVEKTAEGRIEVALRLFPDDVEQVLSAEAGRRVVIGDTPAFRDELMKYIGSRLVIDSGKDRARFRYVGFEPSVNLLWVFIEAEWPRSLKGARLTNRLLLEVSADQMNTVNLTEGAAKETFTFTATHTTADLFAQTK